MKYLRLYIILLKTYVSTFWDEYRNSKEISWGVILFFISIIYLRCLSFGVYIENQIKDIFSIIIFEIFMISIFGYCIYAWKESDKTRNCHRKAKERCDKIIKEIEFKDLI